MRNAILACFTVAVLVPTVALAQTTPNTAYAELSKVQASGKKVQLFGVPLTDSTNVVRYYDVTVTLPILSNGTFGTRSTTSSVLSPPFQSSAFIPGTYTYPNFTCPLTSSAFGGQFQLSLACTYVPNGSSSFQGTWYTGPIAQNPYVVPLTAAKLDTIPNSALLAWGRVGQTAFPFPCFNVNDLFSAQENFGSTTNLTLVNYRNSTTPICSVTLTLSTTP